MESDEDEYFSLDEALSEDEQMAGIAIVPDLTKGEVVAEEPDLAVIEDQGGNVSSFQLSFTVVLSHWGM